MKDEFEEEFDTLEKRIKNESDRKIFQKVFDAKTLKALKALADKKLFNTLEHIVSTGKEAHVYAANDGSGNIRAVKIFKKETTQFKNMNKYIENEERFKKVKKGRMNLVFAWAKKEYRNLMVASDAKLSVPLPIGHKENVIVMEFIGEKDEPSPRLKEAGKFSEKELLEFREQVIDFIAGMYNKGLVHADLSEYNILVKGKKLVVIDFAQAVTLSHPSAGEFFKIDVQNMAKYFTKMGLETSYEELYESIKKRKEISEKSQNSRKSRKI